MLSPELVRAKVIQGELKLTQFTRKTRDRALELATEYLLIARQNVGHTREELKQSWALVPATPGERRLADGLLKLVEDACDFGSEQTLPPSELRREVFLEASRRRQSAPADQPFDRADTLNVIAHRHELTSSAIEEALYADLKGAQKLKSVGPLEAASVVEHYEVGQVQAVLLRAVEVVAEIHCESPLSYRHLFNKLKFRRLLYSIEALGRGYRVRLDGPFSLFESVTKYGLQLALVLPALLECDELVLRATLRWGKQRRPVGFSYTQRKPRASSGAPALPDEVERLREGLLAKSSGWEVGISDEVLNLPGIGVCVPDLVFVRDQQRVYLEVMGYWSRDAVWRRVEMAEKGLGARVLFAVSSRLRVSEAVLEDSESSALYVYKGVMSPAQVLRRIEALSD